MAIWRKGNLLTVMNPQTLHESASCWKIVFCRLMAGIASCILAQTVGLTAAPRPNVVFILADDLGWGDLGCYGSPDIYTPNLDRMAAQGLRFTSFYAAPVCSPARAQLMTGCYAPRVGMARVPFPHSAYGLNPSEVTVADLLKESGYATMCIGKWHLGDAPEMLPLHQGFDRYFGFPFSNDMWRFHPRMPPKDNEDEMLRRMRARAEYTGFHLQGSYFPPGVLENDLPLVRDETVIELNPDQRQMTIRYTEAALEFVSSPRDQPFFLYLAFSMPHVPLFVSDRFAGKSKRGLYGDVVMELDWSVGRILKRLRELKIDKETLVIFSSDNGPWLHYGIDGGSAGPFRDGKVSTYEGGVRVPMIAHWPGWIPAGSRTSAVTGLIDILPTLAGLAGSPLPSDRIIDGQDMQSILAGADDWPDRRYMHYFGTSAEGRINYQGIRDERWKLSCQSDLQGNILSRQLYDLGSDPGERFDRTKQHPEVAERLETEARGFVDSLRKNMRPSGKRQQDVP